MIIRYEQEIAYSRMMHETSKRLDGKTMKFLAEEFYTALFEKYLISQNQSEKIRMACDLEQIMILEEKTMAQITYVNQREESKEEDDEDNSGEEWKLNG